MKNSQHFEDLLIKVPNSQNLERTPGGSRLYSRSTWLKYTLIGGGVELMTCQAAISYTAVNFIST
jgi:hypothetical protein